MKSKQVLVFRNVHKGWGIIKDGKHIDTSKALFLNTLDDALNFCHMNNLDVLRICR